MRRSAGESGEREGREENEGVEKGRLDFIGKLIVD